MFKNYFKYYKSKKPPPTLEGVLDFEDTSRFHNEIVKLRSASDVTNWHEVALKDPQSWEIYGLKANPGFIFIKNPFSCLGHRYWTVRCLRDFPFPPNITNLRENVFNISMCKEAKNCLRWATLGYQYNWDTKEYSESSKNPFPEDLSKLASIIGDALNYRNFRAEAAIVNYYYFNSTLSGHTDHSEDDLEAPLLSFSFGQSAIFLLGGKSLDDKPTPILIRSGDIVAMTKESRLSYHGVPKILEGSNCDLWSDINQDEQFIDNFDVLNSCFDPTSWICYENFLMNSRINVNVRQVLGISQTHLKNFFVE